MFLWFLLFILYYAYWSLLFCVEAKTLNVCFILLTGFVSWREWVKRREDRQGKRESNKRNTPISSVHWTTETRVLVWWLCKMWDQVLFLLRKNDFFFLFSWWKFELSLLKTEIKGIISVACWTEWLVLQGDLALTPTLGARSPSVPTHFLLWNYKSLHWAKFVLSVSFFFNSWTFLIPLNKSLSYRYVRKPHVLYKTFCLTFAYHIHSQYYTK